MQTPLPPTRATTTWGKWRALSGADRLRLLALLPALQIMDLSLRAFGLRPTQRWLGLDRPLRRIDVPLTPDTMAAAHRLAELAAIAGSRGPLNNSCLRQSLIVQWWLRRRGLDPQLRIGARKVGSTVDAHAWLELGSVPLAQPNLSHIAFVSANGGPGSTAPAGKGD